MFKVAALLLGVAPLAVAAETVPSLKRVHAHPVVRGAAGPFASVEVVLSRPVDYPRQPFSGMVRVQGRTIALPGPDEPAEFFIVEPRAVLLTRVDGSRRNGLVVLYRSSRIGPGHGTEHRALVYRVEPTRAVRLPALEVLLEGARDAATARRLLRAVLAR
jgi:hypothetical protein